MTITHLSPIPVNATIVAFWQTPMAATTKFDGHTLSPRPAATTPAAHGRHAAPEVVTPAVLTLDALLTLDTPVTPEVVTPVTPKVVTPEAPVPAMVPAVVPEAVEMLEVVGRILQEVQTAVGRAGSNTSVTSTTFTIDADVTATVADGQDLLEAVTTEVAEAAKAAEAPAKKAGRIRRILQAIGKFAAKVSLILARAVGVVALSPLFLLVAILGAVYEMLKFIITGRIPA